MSTDHITRLAVSLLFSIFILQPSSLRAQGPLTPPGAPGATMKSLSQIEPRTPISSAPFTITTPGSYYLTANLSVTNGDGIDINTNGVTLDLSGFTITSTAPSANGTGIYLALATNTDITILNGHIKGGVTNNGGAFSGPGFVNGISCNTNGNPFAVLVSRVSVSGCLSNGIFVNTANLNSGNATVVEACTLKTVGGSGIVADSVSRCSVYEFGIYGIEATTVSDCRAESPTSTSDGIIAWAANNCYASCTGNSVGIYSIGVANNCQGYSTVGTGLFASQAANNCAGHSNSGTGLQVFIGPATGCFGYSNFGTGLSAQNASNCYGYSNGNGPGLLVTGTAMGCYGSSFSGVAINANIANSCSVGNGTTSIANKYNMP